MRCPDTRTGPHIARCISGTTHSRNIVAHSTGKGKHTPLRIGKGKHAYIGDGGEDCGGIQLGLLFELCTTTSPGDVMRVGETSSRSLLRGSPSTANASTSTVACAGA